jgi:NADH-quinone oxidoreductase subunit K
MQTIPLNYYLILAALIFVIGVVGVLTRRNAIIIFMSIEMMLNSVNLTFVAFASYMGDTAGQIFVFFVMAVAAAEAAVGLAIVLALFRNKKTVYVDEVNVMKW